MKSTKKLQIGASGNMLQKGIILTSLVLIIIVFTCLSDNFFTLTAPAPYRVTVQTSRSVEELEQNLTIKSVYDIR